MQRVVTIARRHGTQKWEVAIGPERPLRSHRQFLKSHRVAKSDPEFDRVSMLEEVREIKLELPPRLKMPIAPVPKFIGGPPPNPVPVPPNGHKFESEKGKTINRKPVTLFGSRLKKVLT